MVMTNLLIDSKNISEDQDTINKNEYKELDPIKYLRLTNSKEIRRVEIVRK